MQEHQLKRLEKIIILIGVNTMMNIVKILGGIHLLQVRIKIYYKNMIGLWLLEILLQELYQNFIVNMVVLESINDYDELVLIIYYKK